MLVCFSAEKPECNSLSDVMYQTPKTFPTSEKKVETTPRGLPPPPPLPSLRCQKDDVMMMMIKMVFLV